MKVVLLDWSNEIWPLKLILNFEKFVVSKNSNIYLIKRTFLNASVFEEIEMLT